MINGIGRLLRKLLALLPDFDVSKYVASIQTDVKPYASFINWIMPVSDMYDIFVLWCKCMTAYFIFITLKPMIKQVIGKLIDKVVK